MSSTTHSRLVRDTAQASARFEGNLNEAKVVHHKGAGGLLHFLGQALIQRKVEAMDSVGRGEGRRKQLGATVNQRLKLKTVGKPQHFRDYDGVGVCLCCCRFYRNVCGHLE